uniref:Homeobox domain-containing protein n=1 Tax=Caenorhabditis tropicalis TaxID=1561998 RepID=A0A1I7TL98_9PELO
MLPDSGQFATDPSLPRNDDENSFDLRQPLEQQEQTQTDFFNIEPEFTGNFLFGNEPLFYESLDYPQQQMTVEPGETQQNQPQQDISNSGVNDMRRSIIRLFETDGKTKLKKVQIFVILRQWPFVTVHYATRFSHNEWEMMPETPVQHHGQQQSDTMNHGSNGNSSMSMEFNSCDQNEMGFHKNQESNMNQREHQFTHHTVHHIVRVTPSNEVITVSGKHLYQSSAEPANLQKSTVSSHVFIKCGNTVESQNEVRQIDANDTSKDNRNDKSNDNRNNTSNDDRNDTPNENCRDKKKTFTPYTPAQLEILCEQFEIKNYLTNEVRDDLAQKTGLTPHKIVVWFSNRRKRIRDKPKVEVKRRNMEATRREEAKVWVNEAIAMYDEKIISEELAENNFD